jgi:hypothetical protein
LNNARPIESQIRAAEIELANLTKRKIQLENEIKHLKEIQHSITEKTSAFNHKTKPGITVEDSLQLATGYSSMPVTWNVVTPCLRPWAG